MVQPRPATKNHMAILLSLTRWDGEQNQRKKAKLMGRDKDSLTEQQRKKIVTTIIFIKIIYKTMEYRRQLPHCPMPSALLRYH